MSALLAAGANASNDGLAVGLVIGVLFGLVVAPIGRSWIVRREWRRASREAALTDELLDRIERDAASADPTDPEPARRPDASWQPSR